MSSLDFELDRLIDEVEERWHAVYTESQEARLDLETIAAGGIRGSLLEHARERLERLEAEKLQILLQIEHLETGLGQRAP